MKKSRLPNELSLEELLKAASTGDTSEEVDKPTAFDDDVVNFLQAFKILPGKKVVTGSLLFMLFKKWSPSSEKSISTFSLSLNRYLPKQNNTQKSRYLINRDILKISKDIQDLIDAHRKERTKFSSWHLHTEKFLEDTGLGPGDLWVEADILYYVYNRWVDDTRKTKYLGYPTFKEFCRLIFEVRQQKLSNPWIGVNNKLEDLITKEEILRWREGRRRNVKPPRSKKEKVPKKSD